MTVRSPPPHRLSMKINSELIVDRRSQHTSSYKTIVRETIGRERSRSLGEQRYSREPDGAPVLLMLLGMRPQQGSAVSSANSSVLQ
ncbi:hypothetical protein NQZ68_024675 [Dissostichus eleginoides]|nr:hypothetical protein NQZ68_024675 [Dissostichus eleginoides]